MNVDWRDGSRGVEGLGGTCWGVLGSRVRKRKIGNEEERSWVIGHDAVILPHLFCSHSYFPVAALESDLYRGVIFHGRGQLKASNSK